MREPELHVETAGDGPAVVLVHAGVADSRMWDAQWEAFSDGFRVVRYDQRGFGRSPMPPESFSLARDLLGVLDRLEIERAALVGVSLGGRVALEVAVAAPDRVSALVLVGAGLPGHDRSEAMRQFDADEEAALDRGDLEAASDVNARFWLADDANDAVRGLVHAMQLRAFELQLPVEGEADEEPLVPDVADRLGEIAAPTLAAAGEKDVSDFHEIADRLAREIPGARRASIPGAAHLAPLETPDAFNALVLPFLEEHAPA